MSPTVIDCPHCQAQLRLSRPGRRIRCPACKEVITLPERGAILELPADPQLVPIDDTSPVPSPRWKVLDGDVGASVSLPLPALSRTPPTEETSAPPLTEAVPLTSDTASDTATVRPPRSRLQKNSWTAIALTVALLVLLTTGGERAALGVLSVNQLLLLAAGLFGLGFLGLQICRIRGEARHWEGGDLLLPGLTCLGIVLLQQFSSTRLLEPTIAKEEASIDMPESPPVPASGARWGVVQSPLDADKPVVTTPGITPPAAVSRSAHAASSGNSMPTPPQIRVTATASPSTMPAVPAPGIVSPHATAAAPSAIPQPPVAVAPQPGTQAPASSATPPPPPPPPSTAPKGSAATTGRGRNVIPSRRRPLPAPRDPRMARVHQLALNLAKELEVREEVLTKLPAEDQLLVILRGYTLQEHTQVAAQLWTSLERPLYFRKWDEQECVVRFATPRKLNDIVAGIDYALIAEVDEDRRVLVLRPLPPSEPASASEPPEPSTESSSS
ncbi:hypothetical protein [Planctomicrobium sp. SH664]|uniref:hypothetical protein n=1 Tax=Planctomicrobium sp. SH664 TaxID=3448125 RepID=UPI003F5C7858